MSTNLNRRRFISSSAVFGAGLGLGVTNTFGINAAEKKPAILGGPKAHTGSFPA